MEKAIENLKLLIFDLDGVITSESKYWNTARLTVWELICSPSYLGISNYFGASPNVATRLDEIGDRIISKSFIYELKSRAINSNWDLTFFVVCLHLVGIVSQIKASSGESWQEVLNQDMPLSQKLPELGKLINQKDYNWQLSDRAISQFWNATQSLTGTAVLDYVNYFVNQELGAKINCFDPKGELWQLCYQNFQDWYEEKKGYTLPDDETVLAVDQIAATLQTLYNGGYKLAIATGRPRQEVIAPMTALGLLQYFDSERIVTYDEVLAAEATVTDSHPGIKLGKPHPFIIFKASHPDISVGELLAKDFQFNHRQKIAYIGDAGSDVVAAKTAGCLAIGVLTGFGDGDAKAKKRQMLGDLGCKIILDSILDLPELLGVKRA